MTRRQVPGQLPLWPDEGEPTAPAPAPRHRFLFTDLCNPAGTRSPWRWYGRPITTLHPPEEYL